MVNTRSTIQKQRQLKKEEQSSAKEDDVAGPSLIKSAKAEETRDLASASQRSKCSGPSHRTSTSSVVAQKKKLELEAAKAKAQIQVELINKKLAADLAALDEKYSPPASESQGDGRDIEEWLERSQQELERQGVNKHGKSTDPLFPPLPEGSGTNGAVQQLASALRDLITTSVPTSHNENLLSRLSTPRELPMFSGDPMEWLFFKSAYQESTHMCNFSEKENLWRLRKCLRGPAKEAVSALLVTSTSPETVMSTLELQFGNPDIIISKILHDVKKLNPLPPEYHKDIIPFSVKIKNCVASVRQLKRHEYIQGVDVVNMVLSKLPTVLLSKWADYSYPLIKAQEKCRLDILSDFLSEEAVKISTSSAGLLNVRWDSKRKHYSDNEHTVLLQAEKPKQCASNNKCSFCRTSNHDLTDCKKFRKSLRKDRWSCVKRSGICYKCLLSKHNRQTCTAAACGVDGCAEQHHRLLHYVPSSRPSDNNITVVAQSDQPGPPTKSETSETVTNVSSDNNSWSVLLKVVPINIHGPNGVFSTSALLDDGSTVSMISASLASRVGVSGHKQTIRVRGAWDNTELLCETELLDLTVSNKLGEKYNLNVRSVNELNLPKQNLSLVRCESYDHLRNLKDDLSVDQFKPEVLIGQDNCHLLLPLETVVGGRNQPCATRTALGWCLHGVVPHRYLPARNNYSTFFITEGNDANTATVDTNLHSLHEDVRRYFSIESMGVSAAKPRQNSEELRAWNYLEQKSTLINGRWHVNLPWKNEDCTLPDSYPNAMSRLRGVERKMRSNPGYSSRYEERIHHLISNDYASEINNKSRSDPLRKIWYLPHFGVDNPNKQKLRLVFDAAAKTNGLCLNDYILKGPDLLISLYGTMLRFRENKIAITGDIRDMFLRIKIMEEDRDALRFLWRESPDHPVKTYVMSSLIFGANCSPFVAQFIKNKNAKRFESSMSSAVQAICKQHYMDDYIDSVEDEETAIKLVKDVTYIHKQGGFDIRNWTCNSQTVLCTIPQENLRSTDVAFKVGQTQYDGERTLGIIWNPKDDSLRFDVSFKRIPIDIITGQKKPTKREMLSVVMSIFDVYGFLSPFTINGKIILQKTWHLNISWDDPVTDETFTKWQKWIRLLKSLRDVRLPRHYPAATTGATEKENATGLSLSTCATPTAEYSATSVADDAGATSATSATSPAPGNSDDNTIITECKRYRNLQMHIFCDASTKAICAVAYWRWIDYDSNVRVAFIASKCRVAGNKPITVPRLELQAAVLAARLADSLTKDHKIKAERRVFWSDSTTVLHWISNDARNYKIYVANRLGEIDDLTQKSEWRYVPTKINVADIATRESYDCSALQNEWMYGPTFLYRDCEDWPQNVIKPENENVPLECLTVTHKNETIHLPLPEPTRFSSWLRLLRSTSKVLTFVDMGLKAIHKLGSRDHVMDRAERLLLIYSQAQSFEEEIALLKSCKRIPTTSKLLTLSPYLDEHGVMRVGGRIGAAPGIPPETKNPIILDGRNYVARLIVKHYHHYYAHGNRETVVNEIKQKYWITRLRPTVRQVTSKCSTCRIRKSKPEVPRMGDLPVARMAHHERPFTHCGVDLFGPMEVTVGRRREKRYGVLFTCLTVRAVHLEVVTNLTTDSLVMALRRMAARRGWPSHIYSDNGTNLRGAHAELKKSVMELDEEILKNEAENHGTKWSFIPPASPHWGGAWERLIRSVKTSLKVVLKERAPKEETLNTLLMEVENIVNSRPLTHVSVEPGSMETLTPNHFLLGSSSNLPQLGKFDDSSFYLRKQWRVSQRLADMFWNRWVKEVLPDLIPRRKWNAEPRPLQVGDLVVIVDPTGPRNLWPKGIIQEVCPGKDGRVRVVKIKTRTGMMTRSAPRVVRILIGDECC